MPQKPSQGSQAYQDRHAYIPPHVQEAMTKQMQQMVPKHMKGYAGAYVQQNMVNQGPPVPGKVSGPPAGYGPVTHLPRKDHFHQYKVQQPSRASNFVSSQSQTQPPSAPTPAPQTPAPTAYTEPQYQQPVPPPPFAPTPQQQVVPGPQPNVMPDYDFIMGDQQPPAKKSALPNVKSSLPIRIGLAVGGLLVLLILFNVVRGLLSGPSTLPYYLSIIQDQQEIVHLTSNALEQTDLSTAHQNFAATASLSLSSSQADLTQLLASSNKKIDPKKINLKVSTSTDDRLATAAAGGTYNATFNEIMQDQLKTYSQDIQTTYQKSKSAKSRAILNDQYKQAQLLSQQLISASPRAN